MPWLVAVGQTRVVDAVARRALAIRVALAIAERLGMDVDRPHIIKDSNNTIVGINDRAVVKVATTTLPGRSDALGREAQVLAHLGNPWVGGNLVATTAGLRMLDFETVCLGPREWDLSSIDDVPEAAVDDPALLDACR